MPQNLADELILLAPHDPSRANERFQEAIPDARERAKWLDDRPRVFAVGGSRRDGEEGGSEPGAIAAAPAIVGLRDKGRRRYHELTGEDAPQLE